MDNETILDDPTVAIYNGNVWYKRKYIKNMTYDQAKMIIYNTEYYTENAVKEACIEILSKLNSKPEDILQASSLLYY